MSIRKFLVPMVVAGLVAAGCSDDDGGVTLPQDPTTFVIPTEISFEEAAAQAEPGDTLEFLFSPLGVGSTVVIQSAQTPLVLRGNKVYPALTAPVGAPAVRFLSPKAGTRVEGLSFLGGSASLDVTGAGAILVENCRFLGGQVGLRGSGQGLVVTVTRSLFRDAALYGIQVESRARVEADRVTVVDAGDCGILVGDDARARVTSSILWRAVNFGIACVDGGVYDPGSGCNDLFLNGNASYGDCTAAEGDFHVDPLFCNVATGDFTVRVDSFCAPANSGGCGQVGAFGPACEPPPPVPPAGSR